jgi:hypothetical protein
MPTESHCEVSRQIHAGIYLHCVLHCVLPTPYLLEPRSNFLQAPAPAAEFTLFVLTTRYDEQVK